MDVGTLRLTCLRGEINVTSVNMRGLGNDTCETDFTEIIQELVTPGTTDLYLKHNADLFGADELNSNCTGLDNIIIYSAEYTCAGSSKYHNL